MDEEVVLLEEQLSTAQQDIEALQTRLAEADTREAERVAEVAELRRQVATREEALSAQTGELEGLRSSLAESQTQVREAAARYRQSVLEREPELPADLVAGETVADIDAAVSQARQTVAQVRQHLETQAQSLRVPAGAPVRGAPDTSDMTATEKIRSGIRGA